MKAIASAEERDRATADLKTLVMMASDPELNWTEKPPTIINQGGVAYRAYPILATGI
jgi:hypothetical protein